MELVELVNLNKDEYEKFVENSAYSHFMQSYYFGEIRKEKKFKPYYLGLKKNGEIIGTALILEKKLKFGYSYFYSPRGYIIDYTNRQLIKLFTEKIKEFAKKKKAIFIKIDPAIKRHDIDSDGNIIKENNNYELIEYLKSLHYKHLGYNIGFEHEQPRFTFRIDIDSSIDDVFKRMHPTTRKILNKNNQYNLEIYRGSIKDIDDFYITMIETAKRENILQAPIEYYKTFYEVFNKVNKSDLYIVKANIKDLIKNFEERQNDLNEKITNLKLHENKNKGKINDLNIQLEKLNKQLDRIKEIKEEKIVLSSIITVKYKDTVWTVHGGNNSQLMELNGNYECYWQIIKDANKEGYKIVDCFGTCGIFNPDKNNPIFGIHSFKKRLGGEYTEFIGEFDYVINPILYFLFTKTVPFYRKIVKMKQKGRLVNEAKGNK